MVHGKRYKVKLLDEKIDPQGRALIFSLLQLSRANGIILVDLNTIAKRIVPMAPRFKKDIVTVARANIMKVSKIIAPATFALSSTSVYSASRAMQLGRPSPMEIPRRMQEKRERITPLTTASNAIDIKPVTIQKNRSFLRSTLSLIWLPIIADNAPVPKNVAKPTLSKN